MKSAREIETRIWSDVEIDAAILKSLFKGRIEPLDNMKVNFRKPSSKGLQHLRQKPQMGGDRKPNRDGPNRIATQLLKLVPGSPDIIQNGGSAFYERLPQRCREHSL